MRVSIVNLNIVALDAVGRCLVNQVRYFQRRGDQVTVYVVHPPMDLPDDILALTRRVSLSDLVSRRDEHFAQSDLYVYHYPSRHPLMESMKGIDRGAVVFYYHNVTPPELWASQFERDHLVASQESVGLFANMADLIVADSAYSADQLVQEYGCERDHIRIIPLSVDLAQFKPGPKDLALVQQYRLEGKRVILFVGRMAGNKRIDLLVEALPRILQAAPDGVLMLAGDDQGNPAIQENVVKAKARAEALGVADRVIFTGMVEPAPYYRLASVYATASLHEGFGLPIAEAMASGIPVVASQATAHPWVVGDAGLMARPNDAADLADKIVTVLSDNNLCGELVRRGLERARTFSQEHYDSEWARVIAEVSTWLPVQPYPRVRSLPAQPVAADNGQANRPSDSNRLVLLRGELGQLEQASDVMIRGYTVRSKLPVLGGLIAWVRRTMTSHLREPYIDPMFERQVAWNRRVVHLLQELVSQLPPRQPAPRRIMPPDDADHSLQSEHWLRLISLQLSLLLAQQNAQPDNATGHTNASLATINQQIETIRKQIDANLNQVTQHEE